MMVDGGSHHVSVLENFNAFNDIINRKIFANLIQFRLLFK